MVNLYQVICLGVFLLVTLFLLKRSRNNRGMLPGPPALPMIGHLHLLEPLLHRSFHRLSTRYGPLIQLKIGSLPCVVVSSPEKAKLFLKTHEHTFSSRKMASTAIKMLTYDASFSFAPHGAYWKFIKRVCTFELLGTRNLNHFSPIRTGEIQSFLKLVLNAARTGEAVNVTKEVMKLTNNVISEMMLSSRSSDTEGGAEEVMSLVGEVTKIFGEFNVSDFVSLFKNIDFGGFKKRSRNIHKGYDALLEKIITEREMERMAKKSTEKREGAGQDFLDMLIDAIEDDKCEAKITRDHIKALVLDFLTAGTHTIATALEWTLAELINNPNILKKAQSEIDAVTGNYRLVNESDIPSLPYTQAIIREIFRLHPPVPLITRNSTEDCLVDGFYVSANTLLVVNVWSIGRDPQYWENPLEFRPERFLEDDRITLIASMDVKGQNYGLLPFGSGRRGCPGISLALQQLYVVLAAMIQCFDWKPTTLNGEKLDMNERSGLTTPMANDLVCFPLVRTNCIDAL